ncbi:MAG: MoxR family ATPase [Candidatus Eremiobacterota bacterium]
MSLTESLGILGWNELDPILLAALALETPVLLVGPHGTAKSLLVERVALALNEEFRHYNASLLNYDDLVGIPMPNQGKLEFLGTPGSIWGAGFVFFDELSRCRPDLLNKLFPILHERRVAGLELPGLRHRWAAMNPPFAGEPEQDAEGYLGAETLDLALTDRFGFVVRVPAWSELTERERRAVVRGESARAETDLKRQIEQCRALLPARVSESAAGYVVTVVEQLAGAKLPLSPRRARMLGLNLEAMQAAHDVLGLKWELEETVERTLFASLPQTAGPEPPGSITVRTCHLQAWALCRLEPSNPRRRLLEERDPVRRLLKGLELDLSVCELSGLVTGALADEKCEPRCMGLGAALFLAFREARELTPAAWEALWQAGRRVLEPRSAEISVVPGAERDLWQNISKWLAQNRPPLERNFVLAGFPDLWRRWSWKKCLETFREDLASFRVKAA